MIDNTYRPRGDIAKCTGVDCPLRETCLRFITPSHPVRQLFISPPKVPADCNEYLESRR